MESRHIPDLIYWVRAPQCAQILEIGMFQSLAGAIFCQVRDATVQGQYTGPWAISGDRIFPALKRVVVTYPTYLNEDAFDVETSQRMLFGNMYLKVDPCAPREVEILVSNIHPQCAGRFFAS
ncbi:hypothetical protein E8E12_005024 [Didymella heteroderae]|uniref:Uncharacterized protein n=1 Tax=Didymella heteroderae TaxID=1769908 RepID=A0A9P5C028_9PLEO|nr:hypothetical protein E8E12_005024 [Didymella heteroderae]